MSEPKQKPGKSKQDYGTPWAFIRAVEAVFGRLQLDLAAVESNAKAPTWISPDIDALSPSVPWGKPHERLWLNPPFGNIQLWAARAASYAPLLRKEGGVLLMLTPASIGTEWFADHVHRKALVFGIRPRLTFEGTTDPYPKDLMLSVYGREPGFDVWRWQ